MIRIPFFGRKYRKKCGCVSRKNLSHDVVVVDFLTKMGMLRVGRKSEIFGVFSH